MAPGATLARIRSRQPIARHSLQVFSVVLGFKLSPRVDDFRTALSQAHRRRELTISRAYDGIKLIQSLTVRFFSLETGAGFRGSNVPPHRNLCDFLSLHSTS